MDRPSWGNPERCRWVFRKAGERGERSREGNTQQRDPLQGGPSVLRPRALRQASEKPQLGVPEGRGPLAPGQESCRKSSSVKPPQRVKSSSSLQASRFLEAVTETAPPPPQPGRAR